jgi:hypothetical protein
MPYAPPVERGFSPLDEELQLGPLALSPRLTEGLVRLGTQLPFGATVDTFAFFTGVQLTDETARTVTERAGAALVRIEDAEAAQCRAADAPPPPCGPQEQVLSVDGAMVPLIGGDWAEVKTLAIGKLARSQADDGSWTVQATELSYCSRLQDAEGFGTIAEGELYRRGTDHAQLVCAPTDGAEWIGRLLGFHCPRAIRILDFPHAVEHLTLAAKAVFGAGTVEATTWLEDQRRELLQGTPSKVFAGLRALPIDQATDPGAAQKTRDEVLAYLTKREAQITYADFSQLGYPIGSGIVESANKLVVEARLKGSGMHWERGNVNPLVALRGISCSGRWKQRWPQIWTHLCGENQTTQRARRQQRRRAAAPAPEAPPCSPPPVPTKRAARPKPLPKKGLMKNGKPTDDHPWKTRNGRVGRKTSNPVPA